ncbi:MAG: sulfur transferase domain-containing protein [Woeseiaceae bacterium]
MKQALCAAFASLLLALSACADEQPVAVAAPIMVDLGAVVETGNVVAVDGVSAAGQPDEAAFQVFAESGYAAVIDLRAENEDRGLDEAAVVADLGMDYVSMPIANAAEVNVENALKLEALIASYDGPVLVHCASSNRVGALLAIADYESHGDRDKALAKGMSAGMKGLEGRVKEVLDSE